MLQLNTTRLHQLMRDFHILTKIRIVIFDAEFRELLAYPQKREPFCELLRNTPEGEEGCSASDKNGCIQCTRTKGLVIYRCHAGLTEVVMPITDKSGILAYVMFGQIIPKEDRESIRRHLHKTYPQYAREIDRIPVRSDQELGAVITILQAITTFMMTNRWVEHSKSEFIRQLDHYIENHLTQSITVDDLCEAFHMGRSKLYELSASYLGCGLAEYIRTQRIRHAQRLLLESDMRITDIAYAVGFPDYVHFSRVFKDVTGTSARNYRRTAPNRIQ